MASHARKKHKSIAYEREVKAEDLLADILDNNDDESDEDDEEDQALETLYDDEDEDPESEAQLTEPEEEERDEFLQFMLIRHGSNSVTNSEDGVYYFKAGDIGASRILQYRLRPPLQDAPRDNRHEFVFQMRCIDYQRGWRTQIRMYGVTLTHYSVVVNVYEFEPYFFVHWPWNESSEAQTQLIASFLDSLEKELETRFQESQCVKRYSLESGIDTRGFVDKTSLYLRIYLRCPSLVSKARRVIESPDWEFAEYMSGTYESDIDYVLRYMADEDFSGECTLCIRAGKYTVRSLSQMVVTTDLELDVSDYRHIKLAEEQLTIPYEVTTSCDAEMRSMSGGFPIPSRDPVISLANYSILNDDETKSNTVCFSLGESYNIRKRHPTADVLSYETEVDMMLGWMLYIRVVDPDFLTGYNIINFDLSYFLERVETLKHVDKRASQIAYLSRLAKCKCKVREDRKEDRAHGTRQNKKIYLPGRIQMDMLPIMQEFKLRSHTLNNVSKIFLGSEKEDMSYELIPEKHKTKDGRTELNSYCTKDAILPYRLMCKLRSKLKFFRKARVTGVTIEALLTRGLGFQGKSVVYRKFQRQHPRVMVYVRTEEQRQQDMLNASYGGAHVEKPIKGYYTMPIVTLDFSSLYPSILIAQNMCVTTIITVAEAKRRGWKRASLHGDGSDGDYFQIPNFSTPGMVQRLEELFHSGQSLDGLYSDSDTCFVTPKHKVGIIPMILKGYLAERKSVKRQMAEHGETKERLREYAEDIVKTKEELLVLLESYQTHAHQIRDLLEKEDRPDKLKLQKDLARLLWKVEELNLHVHDSAEARQDAAKECLDKAETEAFLEILADLFQLEIKLCGNSMYGLFGAKTSFLYRRELAAAVTSMGQFMILVSKLEVERKFCKSNGYPIDAKVVYGDSVPETTPLFIRKGGKEVSMCTIRELPRATDWVPWIDGKEIAEPVPGLEVWSDTGFTAVKRIIRHETSKDIVQVSTTSGIVAVTEDHSLLRPDATIVKPSELQVGEELLSTELPTLSAEENEEAEEGNELFWLWGFYFIHGIPHIPDVSYLCITQRTSPENAQRIAKLLAKHYPGIEWEIESIYDDDETYDVSKMPQQENLALLAFYSHWNNLFHYGDHNKKIPDAVWTASRASQLLFMKGCCDSMVHQRDSKRFHFPTELEAASFHALATNLGYNANTCSTYHYTRCYHNMIPTDLHYEVTLQERRTEPLGKVTNKQPWLHFSLDPEAHKVYDVETENHHFAAGVGQNGRMLVIHNTDSIMVKMDGIDRDQARELGMEMSAFASALWPPPHNLEAEKIFQPSLFCKKKKYAAYVYLMDPETGGLQKPKVKSSGLDTVRRDNCKFTTEVMDTALHLLMTDTEGKGVERSIAFIQEQVALLLQGKISFYKLIISKQLRRDNYANPTVHSTLAARLGKRAGERIAYVIKKMPGGTKLYMCGEDPDIAFRTGVPLDYDYYLKKQIMKPIIRLFAAVLAPHLDMDVKEHEKPIHRIVIRRIFTGAHMRKRLITVNHEAIQKMGIFCIVPTCTNCKRTLKSHEKEYCTACKSQKGVVLVKELRQELDQLVEANMCQWRQCQKCMEVETATPIVCDQNDCENYWSRRKTTVDLQRVSTLLESLSL